MHEDAFLAGAVGNVNFDLAHYEHSALISLPQRGRWRVSGG